jgi:hypothetical protein
MSCVHALLVAHESDSSHSDFPVARGPVRNYSPAFAAF